MSPHLRGSRSENIDPTRIRNDSQCYSEHSCERNDSSESRERIRYKVQDEDGEGRQEG